MADTQEERVWEARVRAYQASLIFGRNRFEQRGVKLLAFLGIGVPVLVGGLLTSLYADKKPDPWILATAGLIATFQALASVWALVDNWEEKVKEAREVAQLANELRHELHLFRPEPNGVYDEEKLKEFEYRYGRFLDNDDSLDVPQDERARTRAKAEKRFPKPIPTRHSSVQR